MDAVVSTRPCVTCPAYFRCLFAPNHLPCLFLLRLVLLSFVTQISGYKAPASGCHTTHFEPLPLPIPVGAPLRGFLDLSTSVQITFNAESNCRFCVRLLDWLFGANLRLMTRGRLFCLCILHSFVPGLHPLRHVAFF